MPGNKTKEQQQQQQKNNNNINKNKKKKNETINLTKILYKTAIFNLQKVNIKSLRDKKEIYGEI